MTLVKLLARLMAAHYLLLEEAWWALCRKLPLQIFPPSLAEAIAFAAGHEVRAERTATLSARKVVVVAVRNNVVILEL
jgi:hypothetical protein